MYENEPTIIKEFRSLYDYVSLMGRHISQIHNRLEKIEEDIKEINSNQSDFIRENSAEISNIRERMVTKVEFNQLIEQMKTSIGEILPPLPALVTETIDIGTQQEVRGD